MPTKSLAIVYLFFSLVNFIASSKTNDAGEYFHEALVIGQDYCDLTIVNSKNPNEFKKVQLSGTSGNCHFDFLAKDTIYGTFNETQLKSAANPYSAIALLVDSKNPKTSYKGYYSAIAVDYLNEKLYAIPVDSDNLIFIDPKTSYLNILLSDLHSPEFIAVDPDEGSIFIGQVSSIVSASLDGTLVKSIVNKRGIKDLALDTRRKKIFWVSANTIESSDYNGKNPKVILKNNYPVRSLTAVGDRLYWYEPPKLLYPNSTIWTCNSTDCDKTILEEVHGDRMILRSYNFTERKNKMRLWSLINPCKNAECQHLCLLARTYIGYTCACGIGYRLDSDGSSCVTALDEFLIYSQKNFIKGILHDNNITETNNLIDVIYPNRIKVNGGVVGMDYDYERNLIYFTDDSSIYVKEIDSEVDQVELYRYDAGVKILASSYDWISRNIYVVTASDSSYTLRVHSFPNDKVGYKRTVLIISRGANNNFDDVVIDPLRGCIHVSMYNQYLKKIDLNGRNAEIIYQSPEWYPKSGIGFDLMDNNFYWVSSNSSDGRLVALDADSHVRFFFQDCLENPSIVRVYKGWLYLGNGTNICRVDKNGDHPQMIIDSNFPRAQKTITDFSIYSRELQPRIDQHPCADDQNGCEKFCFAVPSSRGLVRECACEDHEVLASDGRTCFQN